MCTTNWHMSVTVCQCQMDSVTEGIILTFYDTCQWLWSAKTAVTVTWLKSRKTSPGWSHGPCEGWARARELLVGASDMFVPQWYIATAADDLIVLFHNGIMRIFIICCHNRKLSRIRLVTGCVVTHAKNQHSTPKHCCKSKRQNTPSMCRGFGKSVTFVLCAIIRVWLCLLALHYGYALTSWAVISNLM